MSPEPLLGIHTKGIVMKYLMLALSLLLAACAQEEPDLLSGTWIGEETGSKIRIGKNDDCRYFFSSKTQGGLTCTLERLSDKESRITFSRRGIFVEGNLERIGDSLFFKTPSGGLDILDIQK